MIVINKTKRLIILKTKSGTSYPLTVGSSDAPDDLDLESPSVADLLKSRDIEVPGGIPEGENKPVEFSKLKQADAILVVENCLDKDALASYFEQTKNNQVKAAIKARIAVIEENDRKTAEELAKKNGGGN